MVSKQTWDEAQQTIVLLTGASVTGFFAFQGKVQEAVSTLALLLMYAFGRSVRDRGSENAKK